MQRKNMGNYEHKEVTVECSNDSDNPVSGEVLLQEAIALVQIGLGEQKITPKVDVMEGSANPGLWTIKTKCTKQGVKVKDIDHSWMIDVLNNVENQRKMVPSDVEMIRKFMENLQ